MSPKVRLNTSPELTPLLDVFGFLVSPLFSTLAATLAKLKEIDAQHLMNCMHIHAHPHECHAEPLLRCMLTHAKSNDFHAESLLKCMLTHVNPHEIDAEHLLK